jgi:hypothetical protein
MSSDYYKKYFKKYYLKNKNNYIIPRWRQRGVRDSDFKSVLKFYLECDECMICKDKFDKDIQKKVKCLDHCHKTGEVRYVCCWECNLFLLKERYAEG